MRALYFNQGAQNICAFKRISFAKISVKNVCKLCLIFYIELRHFVETFAQIFSIICAQLKKIAPDFIHISRQIV